MSTTSEVRPSNPFSQIDLKQQIKKLAESSEVKAVATIGGLSIATKALEYSARALQSFFNLKTTVGLAIILPTRKVTLHALNYAFDNPAKGTLKENTVNLISSITTAVTAAKGCEALGLETGVNPVQIGALITLNFVVNHTMVQLMQKLDEGVNKMRPKIVEIPTSVAIQTGLIPDDNLHFSNLSPELEDRINRAKAIAKARIQNSPKQSPLPPKPATEDVKAPTPLPAAA